MGHIRVEALQLRVRAFDPHQQRVANARELGVVFGQRSQLWWDLALIESLSGSFANTGEAVFRNLVLATERVNARGGVPTAQGRRPLVLERYDNKGQTEESLSMLRAAIDSGAVPAQEGV